MGPKLKAKKEPRYWTAGLAVWFTLSILASIPAWAAMYVHRNWSDNSLFEMANHTHWHFALGMLCVCLLDVVLRWLNHWRAPWISRTLHAAILLIPTVYLCGSCRTVDGTEARRLANRQTDQTAFDRFVECVHSKP